jgi:hypothetical protein
VGDAVEVEQAVHVQHRLLGGFEHGIQPAQHGHRQDHVAILAAHVQIPQHVVGNAPDEVGDPGKVAAAIHVKWSHMRNFQHSRATGWRPCRWASRR